MLRSDISGWHPCSENITDQVECLSRKAYNKTHDVSTCLGKITIWRWFVEANLRVKLGEGKPKVAMKGISRLSRNDSSMQPTLNIFQLLLAFFSDGSAGSAGSACSSACQACQSITSKQPILLASSNGTSMYSMCSWNSANQDLLTVHGFLACEILEAWSTLMAKQPEMPEELKAHPSLAGCPHPVHTDWQHVPDQSK